MSSAIGITDELKELHEKIQELQKRRREIFAASSGEPVSDYEFARPDGSKVMLSELFGGRDELILIHNMGRACSYCTLWADGFNGVWPHLNDRAAFVVVSPDEPAVQTEFAKGRNWGFPMASCNGTQFTQDMGMGGPGDYWPGASTFVKASDGTIRRMNSTFLGPGDPYCSVWHILDMLPKGENDWAPKYKY